MDQCHGPVAPRTGCPCFELKKPMRSLPFVRYSPVRMAQRTKAGTSGTSSLAISRLR
jgi:hypothetical protein